MVQANELGMHAIGVDISAFNSLIANVKVGKADFVDLRKELQTITQTLKEFIASNNNVQLDNELTAALNTFNKKYFPSPAYKIRVRQKEINEQQYSTEKVQQFMQIFNTIQQRYELKITPTGASGFLEQWYLEPVRQEIEFAFEQLKKVSNKTTKKIMALILSRTIRSCRATTHADLATLRKPVSQPYYCRKHGKICKPLLSILSWWQRYSQDTLKRLAEFDRLRTTSFQYCLQGDARDMDIFSQLEKKNSAFASLAQQQKIRGIFSSPPYVGLIDYHEQHAYAYNLFGFERNDDLEIGPLAKGQSKEARRSYIEDIAQVLNNSKQYLQRDYDVFLVANDKHNLYPTIAKKAAMQIINRYKRPVLNRTKKNKSAYAEIIFHLKER